jgi:hypothetical protein
MNIINLSEEIQNKIKEIDTIRKEIKQRGIDKADAISQYEMSVSITIMKLRAGIEFQLADEKIKNPSVTIMEKIARGICWQEKRAVELAESGYKSIIVNLEACQAQLTAMQSLFRHQDNI